MNDRSSNNHGSIRILPFYIFLCLTAVYIVSGLSVNSQAAVLVKWQTNYNKAVSSLKNKKYNSALEYAKKALTENKNPYTYELAANILQFKKQYKLSIVYYKKSIISVLKSKNFKNPNKFLSSVKNGIALNYLLTGNNLLKERKINSAIKLYKKGLGYASEKQLVNFLTLNLAMSYENSNTNHLKTAIFYANNVIKNNPSDSYAYFIKGRAEYASGELEHSLRDLKDAYKFNSKNKMISKAIYVVKKAIAYKKRKEIKQIKRNTADLFK